VQFSFRIKSCGEQYRDLGQGSRYLHTPCALQRFDSGDIPVEVSIFGHQCGDPPLGYCGEHGTCFPTGGANGDARSAGCECAMGWRGHKCDIQVEGERPDDDSNLWTLVFGALFMYI